MLPEQLAEESTNASEPELRHNATGTSQRRGDRGGNFTLHQCARHSPHQTGHWILISESLTTRILSIVAAALTEQLNN